MGGGTGRSLVIKAIHEGLLATLEILGIVELPGIPLHFVHYLRDADGVRTGTAGASEHGTMGRVGHMSHVVRNVEENRSGISSTNCNI